MSDHELDHRARRALIAPLLPRSPAEAHRASTPLELLFDLVFVVAIAQVAAGLHHGIAENHAIEALLSYALVFFAIWWAWMNFTWFASAFDNDDLLYRIATFVQLGRSCQRPTRSKSRSVPEASSSRSCRSSWAVC